MKNEFTTGQVAKICKVSPRTVNKWFDSGRLRGYRTPGSHIRRIPRANLLEFLKEHCMPLGELAKDFAPARRRAADHRRRGRALARQRDFGRAIQELDEALRHYADEKAVRTRGLIYYRTGDYDKALADLTAALYQKWDRRALYVRALIRYRRGEYDDSLGDLNALIRSNPRDEAAYRLRARVYQLLAERDRNKATQLAGR